MKVWLKVTDDEYELPLQIADSVIELSRLCNVPYSTIKNVMSKERKGIYKSRCIYKCVEIGANNE